MASTSASTGNTRTFQISEAFVRAIQTEVDAGRISSHDGTLIDSTLNDGAAIASAKYYVPFLGEVLAADSSGPTYDVDAHRLASESLDDVLLRPALQWDFVFPLICCFGVSQASLPGSKTAMHSATSPMDSIASAGKARQLKLGQPPDNPDSDNANRDAPPRSEDGPKRPTANESPQDRARREWEEMLARERGGPKDK